MRKELMAPRTDCTTRMPSGVTSPVTTNHVTKQCVFVHLRNTGNLKTWPEERAHEVYGGDVLRIMNHEVARTSSREVGGMRSGVGALSPRGGPVQDPVLT